MKTMGGKRKADPIAVPGPSTMTDIIEVDVEEEIIDFDLVGDSVELEMEEEEEPPQKRHKKHKHKRHKKKKEDGVIADLPPDGIINTPRISKPSLKLKIKLAESAEKNKNAKQKERAPPKPAEKPPPTPPTTPSTPSTTLTPAALKLLSNSKKKKGGKGKESGTSSEEERWLDAIESGKLEEVDDELKKIKDPKLMTARQRAMFVKKTEKEPSPGGEQLLALPSGYKEKVITEEMMEKRALKLQRRKQMAEEKREKDKKKTMDRLLKKQETKSKTVRTVRSFRQVVPQITYHSTQDGTSLSIPAGLEFPLTKMEAPTIPPPRPLCAIQGCGQPKKYNCSKTGVPLCSLQCYKRNLQASRSA